MRVFTQEECKEIVKEFDLAENKNDENKDQTFYRNSVGVYNLPTTLKYVDQITAKLQQKFPNIVFSNTYTREYKNGSYLKIHTDRAKLDLTLSVCLEKTTPKSWPLHVSLNTYNDKIDWDFSTDVAKYTDKYISYDMPEGVGALCEGKKHPHWRDTLECEENERVVCVFYHWTRVPVKLFTPVFTVSCPDVEVHENFLSDTECEILIELSKRKLERSTVVSDKDGTSVVSNNRTSSGTYFQIKENIVVDRTEERIAKLTGYPVENGEGMQILRYDVGQEYKPHFDYFDPTAPGVEKQVENNRICTVLMYLNTPEEGGATSFPDAGIEVKAKKGSVLLFRYQTPTKETKTLHAGTPVVKGEKWVATKWIRGNKY